MDSPFQRGTRAFLDGEGKTRNPYPYRTAANNHELWNSGWQELCDGVECRGIEIESGVYSGCTRQGGDCPRCGL